MMHRRDLYSGDFNRRNHYLALAAPDAGNDRTSRPSRAWSASDNGTRVLHHVLASVRETNPPRSPKAIASLMSKELQRLDSIFSLYREDSEIIRINRSPANQWIQVSSDLIEVLAFAKELSNLTQVLLTNYLTPGAIVELAPRS